jgi:hypothetical protein
MFNLYHGWKAGLGQLELASARETLNRAFFEMNLGFQVNELLAEAYGRQELEVFVAMGLRCFTSKPPWDAADGEPAAEDFEPYLLGLTRMEALTGTHQWLSSLFLCGSAQFFFVDGELALLGRALSGETDEELAESLNISLSAVKKRWGHIFDRVADVNPSFFPADTTAVSPVALRGRGKRIFLLRHLRSHPEELRPTERTSGVRQDQ